MNAYKNGCVPSSYRFRRFRLHIPLHIHKWTAFFVGGTFHHCRMGLNGIGQFLNVIQKAVSRNVKLSSDVENAGDLAGIFYMVQNHSSFAFWSETGAHITLDNYEQFLPIKGIM